MKTFKEIEAMYQGYPELKQKLFSLEPHLVHVFTKSPGNQATKNGIEEITIRREEIADEIGMVDVCLSQMTFDERSFIQYHYFQNLILECVSSSMNWTVNELERLKMSVLTKTKLILIKREKKLKEIVDKNAVAEV